MKKEASAVFTLTPEEIREALQDYFDRRIGPDSIYHLNLTGSVVRLSIDEEYIGDELKVSLVLNQESQV